MPPSVLQQLTREEQRQVIPYQAGQDELTGSVRFPDVPPVRSVFIKWLDGKYE